MDGEPIILKDDEYYIEHPDELDDLLDRIMEMHDRLYKVTISRLIENTSQLLDCLNQLAEDE